jgi:hypothetical protein
MSFGGVSTTELMAVVVSLYGAMPVMLFRSDFHDRRHRGGCLLVRERRRMSDKHPCREFFIPG